MTTIKGSPKPPDANIGDMTWSMFLNPAFGPVAPSAADRRTADREEIILIACGFTLGFGWLWFPFLSAHWLPAFLWGGPFTGGGASLFIAILAGGFILYGLVSPLKSEASPSNPASSSGERRDSSSQLGQVLGLTSYHRAHAAAILVAALELPPALSAWEVPPGLRVAALAAAALSMGIFWDGRLLSLPPRQAGWAMATASVIGLSLAIPLPACPFTSHGLCLALPLALAWGAAWRLNYLQKNRPEPKRPRGRPPKSTARTMSGVLMARPFTKSDAALAVTAFFMMGLSRVGPDGSPANIWPSQFIAIIGVAGSMSLFWAATRQKASSISFFQELNPDHPQVPLCLALACQGVGELLAPELFYMPAQFLLGATCLATTLLLAGAPLRVARPRAALALALILSNFGTEIAAWLARTLNSTNWLWLLASEPAARLIGLATLLAALAFWTRAASPPPGSRGISPEPGPAACGPPGAAGLESSSLLPPRALSHEPNQTGITITATNPGLTSREEEIMRLAIRGCSNRQIGERLEIQEVTVRFHLRNIYKKTGLQNRKGLMALANQLEWDRDTS